MKPQYHYLLTGTLYRRPNSTDNLIEVNEEFNNDNLWEARQRAFTCYQNYIDVFLQSQNAVYISHEETKRLLSDFVSSHQEESFKMGDNSIAPIDVDFPIGLSIYLIYKNSQTSTTREGEPIYSVKFLMHRIDNGFTDHTPYIFNNLLSEHEIYQKLKIDTIEHEEIIFFYENDKEAKNATILPTPINFNHYFDPKLSLDDLMKMI